MQHISLTELKEAAKPPPPEPEPMEAVNKLKAALTKLKALIPTVTNAARRHPDI